MRRSGMDDGDSAPLGLFGDATMVVDEWAATRRALAVVQRAGGQSLRHWEGEGHGPRGCDTWPPAFPPPSASALPPLFAGPRLAVTPTGRRRPTTMAGRERPSAARLQRCCRAGVGVQAVTADRWTRRVGLDVGCRGGWGRRPNVCCCPSTRPGAVVAAVPPWPTPQLNIEAGGGGSACPAPPKPLLVVPRGAASGARGSGAVAALGGRLQGDFDRRRRAGECGAQEVRAAARGEHDAASTSADGTPANGSSSARTADWRRPPAEQRAFGAADTDRRVPHPRPCAVEPYPARGWGCGEGRAPLLPLQGRT